MQRWIRYKMPDQMKLPLALGTAQAVRSWTLGLSTMQLYLKRWGFTSQKPLEHVLKKIARLFRF